jgi:hypothetical protein
MAEMGEAARVVAEETAKAAREAIDSSKKESEQAVARAEALNQAAIETAKESVKAVQAALVRAEEISIQTRQASDAAVKSAREVTGALVKASRESAERTVKAIREATSVRQDRGKPRYRYPLSGSVNRAGYGQVAGTPPRPRCGHIPGIPSPSPDALKPNAPEGE